MCLVVCLVIRNKKKINDTKKCQVISSDKGKLRETKCEKKKTKTMAGAIRTIIIIGLIIISEENKKNF